MIELLGFDGVVQVAHQRRIGRLVQVVDAELILDELHTSLVHTDGALLDIDLVVQVLLQQRCDAGEFGVPLRGGVGWTRDDQRRTGLVDEDGVDLVDHGEVVSALDQIVQRVRHIVAQVVEAEFVVGAVGDVGVVGLAPLGRSHAGQDHADTQAEEAVHAAHPLGVTLGQVVVDRDDMHTVTGDRVQVGGQHTGQGLALTGLHLGDIAEVQRRATHDLHLVVLLVQHPPGRLAGHRERLQEQVVQRFAVRVALLELVGLGPQLVVGELLELGPEREDLIREVGEPLDRASLTNP